MKIGYAQTAITPSLDRPVYLAGFGQNRRAESIHDDLYARALAIKDDHTTLVLCALDLIGFFRPHALDVIKQVRQREPNANVIIASTHTHHGPDTLGLWGPSDFKSGVDQKYLAGLKEKIAKTILAALEKVETGNVKSVSIKVPGLAKNARDAAIVDDELTTLQFLDPESGRAIASLFNFPCHPEVLGEQNRIITCDYPHYLRAAVEQVTHAPCIFFNGALGGMMIPDVKNHTFEEAETMGKALAAAGLGALRAAAVDDRLFPLSFAKTEIKIPLRNWKFIFGMILNVLPRKGLHFDLTAHTEVSLARIGPLWLATVPGELLPKIGLQIKTDLRKAGARAVGIIGLANDEIGYIIPQSEFDRAKYEESVSLGPEADPIIYNALKNLIGE